MAKELRELDKVIQIGDNDYNVNAKKAEQLEHKLTVNRVGFLGTTLSTSLVDFDGSVDKNFEIVSALGGKFKGPIRVPNADVLNSDSISNFSPKDNDFFPDAVLNYHDIKNKIFNEIKNYSVLSTWDNTKETEKLTNVSTNSSIIKSIAIITGTDDEVTSCAEYINREKPYSAYIYLASDTGNQGKIYFGTSESPEVWAVQVNADNANTANKLVSSKTFSVDLESSSSKVEFNGENDVKLGVTGTLPESKGGTGAKSLSSVLVGCANRLQSDTNTIVNAAYVIDNKNSIDAIVDGTTTVAKATNATKLNDKSDSYFQKKITIAPATDYPKGPAGGTDGDIMILY